MSELEKIAAINDCNDGRLDWKNDTLADEITASQLVPQSIINPVWTEKQ